MALGGTAPPVNNGELKNHNVENVWSINLNKLNNEYKKGYTSGTDLEVFNKPISNSNNNPAPKKKTKISKGGKKTIKRRPNKKRSKTRRI